VLQFVCECDAVKDTGKEEYLRPFVHIGLDWMCITRQLKYLTVERFMIYLYIYYYAAFNAPCVGHKDDES